MNHIFKIRDIPHGTAKLFFDESGNVDIQRYESSKYPIFKKILDQQLSFFWRPEEINLAKDASDFKTLTEAERHIFTSNLKRQIMLDSIQGRAPSLCYGRIVSDPVLESLIHTWTFFENIHSMSYTHIIRNVYPDPSKIFDEMKEIQEIVKCGDDISSYYDELSDSLNSDNLNHKKIATYLSLVATNALEQIRFQVSFACTFSFGQRNLMNGSSRIVKLIRQDESLHCGITQNLLKLLPKDDAYFEELSSSQVIKDQIKKIYYDVYQQEMEWIDYLFLKGPIFGLTKEELQNYLSWLTAKRMQGMGVDVTFDYPKKDPLPWMNRWIDSENDQPPPQEEEIVSYQTGTVDFNINDDEFKDFEL
jgi:ribonucleoside-diphosphate reductase beta chain